MKKKIISSSLLIVGFLIGATALSAVAGTWTAPGTGYPTGTNCTPPNCNVPAPINVGTEGINALQEKFDSLLIRGGLGIMGNLIVATGTGAGISTQGKVLTALDNIGTVGWRDGGSGSGNFSVRSYYIDNGAGHISRIPYSKGELGGNTEQWSGYGGRVVNMGNHRACMLSGVLTSRENHSCIISTSTSGWVLKSQIFTGDETVAGCLAICIDDSVGPYGSPITPYTQTFTNVITSFSNSTTWSYNTLSASSNNINSAIETSENVGAAVSNVLSLNAGKRHRLTYTLTLNSGTAPTLIFTNQSSGVGDRYGLDHTALSGTNSIEFTPTTSTGYISAFVTLNLVTNFSLTNVQLVQIEQ